MIPVNLPLLDGNERSYLLECVETGWISSEGPFVKRFEEEFAGSVQRKYGVACASGSGGLDIAIAAARIEPGDEVIMPAFTIISPALSVVRAGAVPVLVDSDPLTWNMNVNDIRAKINDRTKAILVVHIYGLPTDMDEVMRVANEFGLTVIEDAAEMHGQCYRERPCGSFGQISVFSFYANKHVTTGEGGMVVTDDETIADRCRGFRNLCFQPQRRFVHEELGWNYRMTNLQAALGLAQLEQLEPHVARKREIGNQYHNHLETSGLQLPIRETDYARNIYWVFGVVCPDQWGDAESFTRPLGEAGIGTRPFFWPMHWQPVFQRRGLFANETYPNAERLARQGFYLPSGVGTSDEQVEVVSQKLRELVSEVPSNR